MMNKTLEFLEKLVSFDTTSSKPNAAMVAYIEAVCKNLGATITRLPSQNAGKIGLVARFGPDAPDGIILSGHCDVVPARAQSWTKPPFALSREGSRLFGRGTTDMKGFLASMLSAGVHAAALDLSRPLTLVFSYDEEIGCVGLQQMQPFLPPLLGRPRLCIVGEPTQMALAIGHKGKSALKAVCHGQNGHSALAPHFVNALHIAGDFMAKIRDLQNWYADHGARDDAYDVPYTTLHVGNLQGGDALNIVPDLASMVFEFRYLPNDGDQEIYSKIENAAAEVSALYQQRFSQACVKIEKLNAYPGFDVPRTSDVVEFAQSLGPKPKLGKVAFGTEAGIFSALGIPTIVCGPGSMHGQGHKPDEYIESDQLFQCQKMLEKAVTVLV